MDELFDIFINSVVDQYDQRGRATARTSGSVRTVGTVGAARTAPTSDLIQLYTILNQTLNDQLNTLDPLNAIRNTNILDPFDQEFDLSTDPLETLREINRSHIRGPLEVRDEEDPSFAVNRDLVDNLYAVRRYYESLARRPTRTLSDLILDELNIEVDITDLEDVKVTLTEAQFDSLEKIRVGSEDIYPNNKCNICLDDFCCGNTLVKLNCKHLFHNDCIKTWLTTQSKKCPVCRAEQM
jgi:hypothetical protein